MLGVIRICLMALFLTFFEGLTEIIFLDFLVISKWRKQLPFLCQHINSSVIWTLLTRLTLLILHIYSLRSFLRPQKHLRIITLVLLWKFLHLILQKIILLMQRVNLRMISFVLNHTFRLSWKRDGMFDQLLVRNRTIFVLIVRWVLVLIRL